MSEATKTNESKLYILEKNHKTEGYVDRFEYIESLILIKGDLKLELSGEEAQRLFRHLKPSLMG